jgi:hypothetical protein
MIDRREALRKMGLGALSLALPGTLLELNGCAGTTGGQSLHGPVLTPFDKISPVDRFKPFARNFSGDTNPDRFHTLLRNKLGAIKQHRIDENAPEQAGVVVVGGGMSGILSAYLLRDLKPVLLDKSERMGGNSRGEAWQGVEYSIGAAYFSNAKPGSKLFDLYGQAGIQKLCRKRVDTDPVLLSQKVYTDFWGGQTDPAAVKQFARVRDFFLDCLAGRAGMPNVPAESDKDIPLLAETDRQDFLAFLVKKLGEPLHPHVHTLLELYCWANLGASMQEVSAAVALNFCAAEFGDILVPPAGNASVAERYLKLFTDDAGIDNARSGATVLDVRTVHDHVMVSYLDHLGVMRRIQAKAVVMACPKFIASRLLDGYEKGREEALGRMGYRSYVVGNACLDRAPQRDLHDLYLMNEGELPFGETRRSVHDHGSCSVTFANYAQIAKPRTVLTICHPLPFDTGRSELGEPDAYDTFHALMEKELKEKILPTLGYYPTDLKELRLTRWGYPIPYAKPGFYFTNSPEILSKPMDGKIFFVNQDTWAAPALETCALEALKWAPKVREAIT